MEAGFPRWRIEYRHRIWCRLSRRSDHPATWISTKSLSLAKKQTGRIIVKASTGNLKRVSLELGGKAPNIVFADADIDCRRSGRYQPVSSSNQGQVCCAGSRLFLEKPIHDEFMSKLKDRISKMRQGDGLDEGTQIGPQISKEQQERILGYIDIAKKEGAELACGGAAPSEHKKGYFVQPTVFTGCHNDMRIAKEEVFGPVLAVIPFTNMDDVAEQANKTTFGLSGAVWTRDVKKAHKFASKFKAGHSLGQLLQRARSGRTFWRL